MKKQKLSSIFFICIIFLISIAAQEKSDSVKTIGDFEYSSISYLDYKLREFINTDSFLNHSLYLMQLNDYAIETESLSDLNFALSIQYNFTHNDNLKSFRTILGGLGTAAALTLGAIHLQKYGGEYFKRNRKK